jgi:small subunit ribosomal protein S2
VKEGQEREFGFDCTGSGIYVGRHGAEAQPLKEKSMSETPATPAPTGTPEAPAATDTAAPETTAAPTDAAAAPEATSQTGKLLKKQELSIPALIEAGVHYGHQPGRWNPLMRNYIFGERNGTHIIDLDQTMPLLTEALEFIRETTAAGGSVLFVGTKRQAQGAIMLEAVRAKQHYVNNRWLGGMLTNWKTVKKSIDRYNQYLDILANEEKREELSKKEQSSMQRQVEKYAKSLEGIRSMDRPPHAIFVVDVGKESIAVQEAKRLHIPIIGIVDTNNSPRDIDLVVPGNDDALRAIDLYCTAVGNACIDGREAYQAELIAQREDKPAPAAGEGGSKTGRRVVEIKQQPRRGRGQGANSAGGGKSYSTGGAKEGGGAPAKAAAKPAAKPAAEATPAPAAPAAAEAPAEGGDKE